MPVSLPPAFVEYILLGPAHDRRQLQDSPILGDVWIRYAKEPAKSLELLITPSREQPAGAVAIAIDQRVQRSNPQDTAEISPLQGVIAARLYFEEVLRVVIPMTAWWHSDRIQSQFNAYADDESSAARVDKITTAILLAAKEWMSAKEGTGAVDVGLAAELLPALDRYVALAGLILWAAEGGGANGKLEEAITQVKAQDVQAPLSKVLDAIEQAGKQESLVWQISLNRQAMPALDRSVPAVKADAARTLFNVNCSKIVWAVIDSGIQGSHPAFADPVDPSKPFRVRKAFDFSRIRQIVSLDNLKPHVRGARLKELLHPALAAPPDAKAAVGLLEELANDAKNRRSIHWELVRPFVEIKVTTPPASDHGTHVAGVIGASQAGKAVAASGSADFQDGLCPDIQLYDFRVLAPRLQDTEFAIIAALQFIRFLNSRTDHVVIHGANLSLSIPHDVRNYACGRTPICLECERLVDSGVLVVAAAGNLGYQSFTTREGSYEGYAAFSVTDPGNADGVITVGSTHRTSPHTYGVSFFSSRGPTGDGRPKPDLVAPGERIRGPFREGWGDLDGTSMAAPHVSGAAAMLMARYSELVGAPRRIKRILCESATDLGRERSFQGHGMLDVLRALQSI